MNDSGNQVEEGEAALREHAAERPWLLTLFNVPDRLSGLVARLGFKPTKKNPAHWWRAFDPKTDRDKAVAIRGQLLEAGLKGKWKQIDKMPRSPMPRPSGTAMSPRKGRQQGRNAKSFGLVDFSRPNVTRSGWRMRQKRR